MTFAPFPEPAAGLAGAPLLTYRGAVYPWHCDHMGHMNVMWYAGKFDAATWVLLASLGLTRAYLQAAGRGMAAVEQVTTYRRELLAGDTVTVTSELLEVGDKTLKFRHAMRRDADAEVCAATTLTGVQTDAQARRATPFAPEILARARALARRPDGRVEP